MTLGWERKYLLVALSVGGLVACGGAKPTVASITPASGDALGGDKVTVTGTGFDSSTKLSVGGVAATSVSASKDGKTLTGVTGAGAVGPQDVVATNGAGSATLAGGFTLASYIDSFHSQTNLIEVQPGSGDSKGGIWYLGKAPAGKQGTVATKLDGSAFVSYDAVTIFPKSTGAGQSSTGGDFWITAQAQTVVSTDYSSPISVGFNFRPLKADGVTKQLYDASAFKGFKFDAKLGSTADAVDTVKVQIPDLDTDTLADGQAVVSATENCTSSTDYREEHYYKSVSGLTTEWVTYTVDFSQLEPNSFCGTANVVPAFTPNKITSVNFYIGGDLTADKIDFNIDNVVWIPK